MTPKERDDFIAALKDKAELHDKTLTPGKIRIWMDVMQDQLVDDFIGAMDEDYKTGKFMPKPERILGLISSIKAVKRSKEPHQKEEVHCDPVIGNAWATYIKQGKGSDLPGYHSEMPLDEALVIVNREAAKYKDLTDDFGVLLTRCPDHQEYDSVLPEHKLEEYWR